MGILSLIFGILGGAQSALDPEGALRGYKGRYKGLYGPVIEGSAQPASKTMPKIKTGKMHATSKAAAVKRQRTSKKRPIFTGPDKFFENTAAERAFFNARFEHRPWAKGTGKSKYDDESGDCIEPKSKGKGTNRQR